MYELIMIKNPDKGFTTHAHSAHVVQILYCDKNYNKEITISNTKINSESHRR